VRDLRIAPAQPEQGAAQHSGVDHAVIVSNPG
jgi:hypothetical protein